jgi:ribose 5-phosphate isomerase B
MRVALAADHAGFALKEELRRWLEAQGHEASDLGTDSETSVDYPDYAQKVARAVAAGLVERGILICGSGVGMAIAANKIHGIRAAHCNNLYVAALARQHNDANVLTLGARETAAPLALEITRVFLSADFADGRHRRRVEGIRQLEAEKP